MEFKYGLPAERAALVICDVWDKHWRQGATSRVVELVKKAVPVIDLDYNSKAPQRLAIRCVLIRDLTDAMYDPQDPPHVSHEQGTELVIQHIERYWCPTVLSTDLLPIPKGGVKRRCS